MKLLNDKQIIERCRTQNMLNPFRSEKIRSISEADIFFDSNPIMGKVISFGTGGHGYDLRLSQLNFKLPKRLNYAINPKKMSDDEFYTVENYERDKYGKFFVIPAGYYALAQSVEYFDMPEDVIAIAVGKSTYARAGLVANITPIEATWRGFLTLELNNNNINDIRIYIDEGICQLLFIEVEPSIQGEYNGIYQDQKGTTVGSV